jgi:hypothetical protein
LVFRNGFRLVLLVHDAELLFESKTKLIVEMLCKLAA